LRSHHLSRGARVDLLAIWNYIADDSVEAADRWKAKLLAACDLLAMNPYAGHCRADLTVAAVRFWSVDRYVVIYRPTSPVEIVCVAHGAQLTRRFLSKRL
jgi:toxin ParE1/3/4